MTIKIKHVFIASLVTQLNSFKRKMLLLKLVKRGRFKIYFCHVLLAVRKLSLKICLEGFIFSFSCIQSHKALDTHHFLTFWFLSAFISLVAIFLSWPAGLWTLVCNSASFLVRCLPLCPLDIFLSWSKL